MPRFGQTTESIYLADLLAWKPLLEDYRRATGDGVKH
jgi:hypothetical protein